MTQGRTWVWLVVSLFVGVAVTGVATGASAASGRADPNIVGGTPAVQGEFPWMVRLSVLCTGALYSQRLVLTAAHCFDAATGPNTTITATTGVVDVDSDNAIRIGSTDLYKAPGAVAVGRAPAPPAASAALPTPISRT